MALLLPIFIGVDGAFSVDRKLLFFIVRIFGLKILTIKFYFDENDGILISLNGRKGKPISKKKTKGKSGKWKRDYTSLLSALTFTKIDFVVYAGGDAESISLFMGALNVVMQNVLSTLEKVPEECKILILPCYVNDQVTVKFSIRFFSSVVVMLFALAHTTKGENYAKRSDRELDGQDDFRSQTDR